MHWVRPELVAEVKYLTWTKDNLLRQVVYEGLREDKPAAEVSPHDTSPETRRTGATGYPLRTATARLTGDSRPGPPDLLLGRLHNFTPGQPGRRRAFALVFPPELSPARAASGGPASRGNALLSSFS